MEISVLASTLISSTNQNAVLNKTANFYPLLNEQAFQMLYSLRYVKDRSLCAPKVRILNSVLKKAVAIFFVVSKMSFSTI